jgi:predicted nucleotidyltransferase
MNLGLDESQLQEIRQILSGFLSIESAILFGSRVTGTFTPSSDVDIALMGDDVSLKDQLQLSARLNDNKSLLKFDVVRYSTMTNKELMDHIRNQGIKIYERDNGGTR